MDNLTILVLIEALEKELEFNANRDTKKGLIRAIEILKDWKE